MRTRRRNLLDTEQRRRAAVCAMRPGRSTARCVAANRHGSSRFAAHLGSRWPADRSASLPCRTPGSGAGSTAQRVAVPGGGVPCRSTAPPGAGRQRTSTRWVEQQARAMEFECPGRSCRTNPDRRTIRAPDRDVATRAEAASSSRCDGWTIDSPQGWRRRRCRSGSGGCSGQHWRGIERRCRLSPLVPDPRCNALLPLVPDPRCNGQRSAMGV